MVCQLIAWGIRWHVDACVNTISALIHMPQGQYCCMHLVLGYIDAQGGLRFVVHDTAHGQRVVGGVGCQETVFRLQRAGYLPGGELVQRAVYYVGKVLYGSLAPEGAVTKITGKEGTYFAGPAKVYDSEEAMLQALEGGRIHKGNVIIIRYEGPRGGPGMPEMLTPTSAIMGAGLGADVALLTDGRFSGGSHGFIVGHICTEAQDGGPIALVVDGDRITINTEKNRIDLNVDDSVLAERRDQWKAPPFKVNRGTLYRYIKNVRSASEGCVTDE